jgi:Holliday junction resolvasome RuvABC endonuclease subunit
MDVAGLDLSMTGTGVATSVTSLMTVDIIRPQGTGDQRLAQIAHRVLSKVCGSELVLIEGYLNHSHTAGITGMVHGAVRTALIEAKIQYATLPPTSLKKFATGRGNADKTAMAVAALKRGGMEFKDDNQCDAWWLMVAALAYTGTWMFDLPAANRAALDKIKIEYRGSVQL